MAVNGKQKGKRGELELAKLIRDLFKVEARRGQQYSGGEDSPDVVTGIPHMHFESKRCQKFQLYEALEQAITDANGQCPVVAHKRNHKEWVFIIRAQDAKLFALILCKLFQEQSPSALDLSREICTLLAASRISHDSSGTLEASPDSRPHHTEERPS